SRHSRYEYCIDRSRSVTVCHLHGSQLADVNSRSNCIGGVRGAHQAHLSLRPSNRKRGETSGNHGGEVHPYMERNSKRD
ncbi:hypothetical protein PFISCL1PPCAC_20809, partial [Pristionchus fissidentatus]